MRRSSVSATTRSGGVSPSTSALVESLSRHSASPSASASSRLRSVGRASSGVWSSLKSPVWTTVPSGVRRRNPTASGMECATRNASTSNAGVGWNGSPGRISRRSARTSIWSRRSATSASVSRVPVDGNVALAKEEGQGADVVLVRVGEEDRAELGGCVTQVSKVGDDQLDAGKLRRREEQAGVDQQELVLALEDHRVEANLTRVRRGE